MGVLGGPVIGGPGRVDAASCWSIPGDDDCTSTDMK